MRSSKSRSRSKSNRSRSIGNIVNRVFDSSGPEGKVRGTPQQIIDKYVQLARDATLSNDRVAAENFQQHAEHYTRMLGEAQREQDARREQQDGQQNRDRNRDRPENGFDAGEIDEPGNDRDSEIDLVREVVDHHPDLIEDDSDGDAQPDIPDFGVAAAPLGEDMIDSDLSGDSNLVETPESKPRKPRARSGRPRSSGPRAGARTGARAAEPAVAGEGGGMAEPAPAGEPSSEGGQGFDEAGH